MGTPGTRIEINTDAALNDVDQLKQIAQEHLKLARELQALPPDLLTAWRGSHAESRVQEIQQHIDAMVSESDAIKDIADRLFASISVIEGSAEVSENYAYKLAAMKGNASSRHVSPETARADAAAAYEAQGFGPEGNSSDTLVSETGSESAGDLYQTGEGLVDSRGHLKYDNNGNKVMPNGNLVDPQGNVVGNRYGVVNDKGQVVNMRGEVVRLENGDAVDSAGNITDYYTGQSKGNLYGTVDADGNVRDESGRMIYYHDGNKVDAKGNVIDRFSGKVVKNINDEEIDRKYWH